MSLSTGEGFYFNELSLVIMALPPNPYPIGLIQRSPGSFLHV